MVLLSEAFHSGGKSLDLSYEGDGAWFVSLNIVSGRHRVSKHHAPLCLGSDSRAYKLFRSFPQTAPTNDAKNCQ